eukprot:CAMPEP_0202864976 /NCGR_PEP_ID=MMETSP1391-20130828/5003_1 /ASSEMBLY_ACC=CAM_ASM_000867 /TAXON_ID=1034604 /ORGANISM="Chlamydomonas leiostraca, Strain SAG 11-49" /LENGTH=102 /DNA_ID=CAMNT_0049544759 /DNA_START=40 /DNA_END=345 /DNA_ORIENTATION=-
MASALMNKALSRGLTVKVQARNTVSGKKTLSSATQQRVQSRLEYLKSLPGVTAPFNDVFDPLSFSATAPESDIRRWRESEITHGRVAMLAALGFIVGEQLED